MLNNTSIDAFDLTVVPLNANNKGGININQGEPFNNPPMQGVRASRNSFYNRGSSSPTVYNHLNRDPAITNKYTVFFQTLPTGYETPIHYPTSLVSILSVSDVLTCAFGGGTGSGGSGEGGYPPYTMVRDELSTDIANADPGAINEETGYSEYDDKVTQYTYLTEDLLNRYLYPQTSYDMEIDSLGDTLYYAQDTAVVAIDSVLLVLENTEHIYQYKVALATAYAQHGRFDDAYSALQDIEGNYPMGEDEEADLANITAIINIQETLADNGYDWGAISNGDKEWLEDMVYNGDGRARYMARWLTGRYAELELLPEAMIGEEEAEKPGRNLPGGTSQKPGDKIALYPNPAGKTLHIDAGGIEGDATVCVYDLAGRMLTESKIQGNVKNIMNIQYLAPGSYIVKILQDKRVLATKHMVKQ
jgi:hypothetical protein